MSDTSTKLGIPYILQQQSSPEVTHNLALYMIEALLRGVIDRTNNPPGGTPADGDSYLVGTAGTGAWAGKNNCIAIWASNAWLFIPGFDDDGAQIAMGAAQEGMSIYVQAENALYRWSGAAWSIEVPTIADNSLTLAKLIDAADQYNIVGRKTASGGAWEDCTRTQLLLAGTDLQNTFIDAQTIKSSSDSALMVQSDDSGTTGAHIRLFHNSTSPAVDDQVGLLDFYGNDNLGAATPYARIAGMIVDPTSGSVDGRIKFSTTIGDVFSNRAFIGAGIYTANVTGGDKGVDTVNASTIYEGGNALSSKYAALGSGNSFTGSGNTFVNGTNPVVTVQSNDSGTNGPSLRFFHNSSSPAIDDQLGFFDFVGNDSGGNITTYSRVSARIVDPTDGSEDSRIVLLNNIGGSGISSVLYVGAGLYLEGASSGDKGIGTVNATSYYANGNLIADTSAYLRLRGFTVGTLAAAGTAGRIAHVTDALAPAWNTALVGGGAVNVGARDNGANWVAM